MKKLIFFFLIVTSMSFSQGIDTTSWELTRSMYDGKYSLLLNRDTIYGVAAGELRVPVTLEASSLDTAYWLPVRNLSDGNYNQAINKVEIYGIDSGEVRANIIYNVSGNSQSDSPPSVNLYGYAHEDSINNFTTSQNFDSINVTDEAVIDTLRTNFIFNRTTGTFYIQNVPTENTVVGRSDGTSYLSIFGTNSSNAIYMQVQNTEQIYVLTSGTRFGGATTGRPFIYSGSGTLSNVTYSVWNDPNTGWLWNSANNFSLVTDGVARATIGTASIDFLLPHSPVEMDETARDLLTPTGKWIIWNTTVGKLQIYNGATWESLH